MLQLLTLKHISFAAVLIGLSACQTALSESDIFRPYDAKSTTITITDNADSAIIDNVARENLWTDLKVVNTDGFLDGARGKLAYRLSRQSQKDAPLIVYCNGNSSDIPNHGDLNTYKITPFGDLLQWDYPGYGQSGGMANFAEIKRTSQTLIDAIDDMKRSPDQPVFLWGYSLGSFVCSDMASRYQALDGLVFEAGAPSVKAVQPYLAPTLLRAFVKPQVPESLRAIDTVSVLNDQNLKILILSGRKDNILPVGLSRELDMQLKQTGHDVTYHEFDEADHFTISWQDGFEKKVSDFLIDAIGSKL